MLRAHVHGAQSVREASELRLSGAYQALATRLSGGFEHDTGGFRVGGVTRVRNALHDVKERVTILRARRLDLRDESL